MHTLEAAAPPSDRRREPRVPAGVPVCVLGGGRRAAGRTVDVSERGLLVELTEPLTFLDREVTVALVLPGAGRHDVEARIVRRRLGEDGAVLLGLALAEGARPRCRSAGAPAGRARRRTGPAEGPWPPGPRPRAGLLSDLRALGARAYELTVLDGDQAPPEALTRWASRLAAEIGLEVPGRPRTARELLRRVAELCRGARPAARASA